MVGYVAVGDPTCGSCYLRHVTGRVCFLVSFIVLPPVLTCNV
jgi:hypothetical protein